MKSKLDEAGTISFSQHHLSYLLITLFLGGIVGAQRLASHPACMNDKKSWSYIRRVDARSTSDCPDDLDSGHCRRASAQTRSANIFDREPFYFCTKANEALVGRRLDRKESWPDGHSIRWKLDWMKTDRMKTGRMKTDRMKT